MEVITTEERPATWDDVHQGALEVLAMAFGIARNYTTPHTDKQLDAAVAIVLSERS